VLTVDGLTVVVACVKRLGLAFKFGFKFPVVGSVPVLFISLIGRQFQSISIREFKLRVIRQNILRYQAIKSKLTCCFKTEIHNYSFNTRKNMKRKRSTKI
jgi:hypothetical protein